MGWFKRNLFLSALMVATAFMSGAGCWLLFREARAARSATTMLEKHRQARDALRRQLPALTETNAGAIGLALSEARTQLAALRAGFPDASASASNSTPAGSIDGYFEIAAFVENNRRLADQARVSIRAGEQFGFGSHVSEGPSMDLLPGVLRQCAALKFLLAALFDARPSSLLLVQRERPEAVSRELPGQPLSEKGGLVRKATAIEVADFFELTPGLSLESKGLIGTDAFKLQFSGNTRALRDFLNRLAEADEVFVVRSVEVEALAGVRLAAPTRTESDAIPLVVPLPGRFSVIVELLRPLGEREVLTP